jgi:NADP-dependent 3-hydroxy acid dehydrogenase YdfG
MPKTWFITGTSSGFGRALTEELLSRGDRVAATVRNTAAMNDLVDRYGNQLWVASLDVTDADGIRSVVSSAFAVSDERQRHHARQEGERPCLIDSSIAR